VCDALTTWYSPATIAVKYVEMRGVGGNCQTAIAAEPALSPAGLGWLAGTAWLESTVQCAGATIRKLKLAFRSGCSKFA
jgi:hypothetical protein